MLRSVHVSDQSVLHEVLNHTANLNMYPLKLERSTFPKPVVICFIIYLFYLCFRTSPDNCLPSCLGK